MPDALLRVKKTLLPLVYPLRNATRPRAFHAYTVGMPRSGTHSVSFMLEGQYRSYHEPTEKQVIDLTYARAIEGMSEADQAKALRQRDKELWIEMEASYHLSSFAPLLSQIFPESKFILLLRDPYSWLDSFLSVLEAELIVRPNMGRWTRRGFEANFGYGRLAYSEFDEPLQRRNLAPLAGYLGYYQRIYTDILNGVPSDRRLIVYTKQLSASVDAITQFLGIDPKTVDLNKAHSDSRRDKSPVLFELDRSYLEAQVHHYTDALLSKHFPTIQHLEDAVKPR